MATIDRRTAVVLTIWVTAGGIGGWLGQAVGTGVEKTFLEVLFGFCISLMLIGTLYLFVFQSANLYLGVLGLGLIFGTIFGLAVEAFGGNDVVASIIGASASMILAMLTYLSFRVAESHYGISAEELIEILQRQSLKALAVVIIAIIVVAVFLLARFFNWMITNNISVTNAMAVILCVISPFLGIFLIFLGGSLLDKRK